MQPISFSRPEKSDGRYVSYCNLGGAVIDPTRRGITNQINYWTNHSQEWAEWVSQLNYAVD